MTDQPNPPPRLSMLLPEEWTLEHWQRYNAGRQEFAARQRAASQIADNLTADYHGAKALIESGFVRFEGDDAAVIKAKEMLSKASPPLAFIGFINKTVVSKIEAAFDTPLSF